MNQIDIINQVEQFYSSAWDKLIITGSIIFAVFGLLLPIIFQLLQNRLLKVQEKQIKLDIKDEINELETHLKSELKKEFDDQIERIKEETNIKVYRMRGAAMHLQGNSYLDKNFTKDAVGDFLQAITDYLKGEDYLNFQTVTNVVIDDCLPSLSKEDLEDIFLNMNISKDKFFDDLKIDGNNLASGLTNNLNYEITKILKGEKNRSKGESK